MVCYIRKIVFVVINRDILLVYNITLLVMSDTNQRDGYYGKVNFGSVGSFARQGPLTHKKNETKVCYTLFGLI